MFVIKYRFLYTDGFWIFLKCVCVCHYGSRETPERIHSFHIYIIIYIYFGRNPVEFGTLLILTHIHVAKTDGSPLWGIYESSLKVEFVCHTKLVCNVNFQQPLANLTFFEENILLPDHGHHWVDVSLPFWSKSKARLYRKKSNSSCHYSWWTYSVKPVDRVDSRYVLYS